ncbi:GAF domain-containing protein [Variovorax sp. RHLX14]|uniref:GAF domain-containing protein n=1 Tax=Variovorax sp. RHLX14 TaxID=1259731 RepID=UPI003F46C0BE
MFAWVDRFQSTAQALGIWSSCLRSISTLVHYLLDLTCSVLRSVSPIYIEYLRDIHVYASMCLSIVIHGRLWGLIACHHGSGH